MARTLHVHYRGKGQDRSKAGPMPRSVGCCRSGRFGPDTSVFTSACRIKLGDDDTAAAVSGLVQSVLALLRKAHDLWPCSRLQITATDFVDQACIGFAPR